MGDRLVGRAGEYAELAAVLDTRASTSVALITGEPGIGKTRLLDELVADAGRRDTVVLRATASHNEGSPPYWLWQQVLGSTAGSPELSAADPTPEQRFAMHEAVARFLEDALAGGVVVLDDLQWADPGSLALLLHLVRRRSGALRLAAAARMPDLESVASGADVRAEIARAGCHIALTGLSTAEVTSLLGAGPDEPVAEFVRARTNGNPLFVQEFGRLLAAGRPIGDAVPDVIRDAVREHLATLPPACRAMLDVAAVLGVRIDAVTVAAVAGSTPDVVVDHLDQAVRGDVVQRHERAFAFRHDLFRETLQADLPTTRRLGIHLRAAQHAEQQPVPQVARIAHHRLAALPLGDREQASSWAEQAGYEALGGFAFETAAELFDRALDVTVPDEARAVRLLVAAGRACMLAGDGPGALERCGSAAERAIRIDNMDGLAAAALAMPEITSPPWLAQVHGWCEQLMDRVPAEDGPVRARLLAQYALSFTGTADDSRMFALSADAVAMAERLGDADALRIALRARQIACSAADEHAERRALGVRLVDLGRRRGRPEDELWGHLWQFDAHVQTGDIEAALQQIAVVDPVIERLGSPMADWQRERGLLALLVARGRFVEAWERLERSLPRIPRENIPPIVFQLPPMMLLSRLTGAAVDTSAALLPDHNKYLQARLTTFLHLAPWHLQNGRSAEAEQLYRGLPDVRTGYLPRYLALLVRAVRGEVAAELGDTDGAQAAYEYLLPYQNLHVTTGAGLAITMGSVHRYLGHTAGRTDVAIEHFEAAVASDEAAGFAPYVALSRFEHARLLAQRGDTATAATMAAGVVRTAAELGMHPLRERAAALVAQQPTAADALTPRQREVAGLVAAGLTNREIAAQLFISERTAENHVQAILTALGFRNRSQIAAWDAVRQSR